MFSNLKKKVSQRRQASSSPQRQRPPVLDDTEKSVTAASEFSSERTTITTTTAIMKIHIIIKFRPTWNINDKILVCLQKQHVDVLLHKSSPTLERDWHQNDLYGKLEIPLTDTMTQAQHMESIKRELQVAIGQPEAIVTLKNWEPRRRRRKMQSTPAGMGRGTTGVGLFGEPLDSNRPPMHPPSKKQAWTPAKIVLQDANGHPIEYNIRLSPQSVQDLQQGGGANNELRDYHGIPVKKNGTPICLLTAQILQSDDNLRNDNIDRTNIDGMDLSHVDQHHRRLHGHVRKPSI